MEHGAIFYSSSCRNFIHINKDEKCLPKQENSPFRNSLFNHFNQTESIHYRHWNCSWFKRSGVTLQSSVNRTLWLPLINDYRTIIDHASHVEKLIWTALNRKHWKIVLFLSLYEIWMTNESKYTLKIDCYQHLLTRPRQSIKMLVFCLQFFKGINEIFV